MNTCKYCGKGLSYRDVWKSFWFSWILRCPSCLKPNEPQMKKRVLPIFLILCIPEILLAILSRYVNIQIMG